MEERASERFLKSTGGQRNGLKLSRARRDAAFAASAAPTNAVVDDHFGGRRDWQHARKKTVQKSMRISVTYTVRKPSLAPRCLHRHCSARHGRRCARDEDSSTAPQEMDVFLNLHCANHYRDVTTIMAVAA